MTHPYSLENNGKNVPYKLFYNIFVLFCNKAIFWAATNLIELDFDSYGYLNFFCICSLIGSSAVAESRKHMKKTHSWVLTDNSCKILKYRCTTRFSRLFWIYRRYIVQSISKSPYQDRFGTHLFLLYGALKSLKILLFDIAVL